MRLKTIRLELARITYAKNLKLYIKYSPYGDEIGKLITGILEDRICAARTELEGQILIYFDEPGRFIAKDDGSGIIIKEDECNQLKDHMDYLFSILDTINKTMGLELKDNNFRLDAIECINRFDKIKLIKYSLILEYLKKCVIEFLENELKGYDHEKSTPV